MLEHMVPEYKTVNMQGKTYYRTRIKNPQGKWLTVYGNTQEELYGKVKDLQIRYNEYLNERDHPSVKGYCEKWLYMQSGRLRSTTLKDYSYKVNKYIAQPIGNMRMSEVTLDDLKMAMVLLAEKSASVYQSVVALIKMIFEDAKANGLIEKNPAEKLSCAGGVSPTEKTALSDEKVETLLDTIRGLPPYTFVMLGLYAGLRREEILGLQWDCVFLDEKAPYVSVQRTWHSEHNRPVITNRLKTESARRDIPLPNELVKCLKAEKEKSNSEFVIADRAGAPLSYSQFRRLWAYIDKRSTQTRSYYRYKDGERTLHMVQPVLGEQDRHNRQVIYTMDFHVTPHQLRHTYITNLIYAGVDPKTVQYLAGHKNSSITMDIYAKTKYNKPKQTSVVVNKAFNHSRI